MMCTVLVLLLLAADGSETFAERFEFGFQQDVTQYPALRLSGPNARQVSRSDDQGLRITLPANRPDWNGVGVETRFGVSGDFDIRLAYEILALEQPAPTEGVGVAVTLKFENPATGRASITRLRKGEMEVFGASRITAGLDGKDRFQTRNVPASGTRGQLRLARTGTTLKYLVAEGGGEFREIHSVQVSAENVTGLQAQARTGQKPASVDVRLIHLSIRAEGIPNRPTNRGG